LQSHDFADWALVACMLVDVLATPVVDRSICPSRLSPSPRLSH
jgi:hypothetical protein